MPGIFLCVLSKSAVEVLSFIDKNSPVSPKDIADKTGLPIRTVFYAINNLVEESLVKWAPSLNDMRHKMYSLNTQRIDRLREIVEPFLVHDLFQIDKELQEIFGFSEIEIKKSETQFVSIDTSSL